MPVDFKPKPIKGLKIQYGGATYDNVIYMSASNDEVRFEHMPNESTTVNITCKLKDAKIITGGDK
jgi:hypothetical protein